MRIATHPGRFHADEVFAIAALRTVLGGFEVVRTRDAQLVADSDMRVDVGERDDPTSGDFDHHQTGGAGHRQNGNPYASFGLVWRHFGARIAGSKIAAAEIDRVLVQPIDAADNGHRLTRSLVEGIHPFTISRLIASLNPLWDEDLGQQHQDRRFDDAVALATTVIAREVATVVAAEQAEGALHAAIRDAADPRIVELPQRLPWRGVIASAAPGARFVVCPYPDVWGVHVVPRGSRTSARGPQFPKAWAGLSGPRLAAASGVPDAEFCHAQRFFASARTRDGAIALARAAMREGESHR